MQVLSLIMLSTEPFEYGPPLICAHLTMHSSTKPYDKFEETLLNYRINCSIKSPYNSFGQTYVFLLNVQQLLVFEFFIPSIWFPFFLIRIFILFVKNMMLFANNLGDRKILYLTIYFNFDKHVMNFYS